MLRCLIVIGFVLSTLCAGAFTVRSVASTDWENPNTWSSQQVPNNPDTIFVDHYITFNQNLSIHAPTVLVVDSGGTLCGDYQLDISCGARLFNYGRIWVNSSQMMDAWNYFEFYAKNNMTISACSLPGYNAGYHNVLPNGHTAVWPPVLCRTAGTYWDGDPSGISELEKSGIKAFPNPAEDQLTVTSESELSISLSDVYGKELLSAKAFQSATINLSLYAPGIYILQARQNGIIYSRKILKTN